MRSKQIGSDAFQSISEIMALCDDDLIRLSHDDLVVAVRELQRKVWNMQKLAAKQSKTIKSKSAVIEYQSSLPFNRIVKAVEDLKLMR